MAKVVPWPSQVAPSFSGVTRSSWRGADYCCGRFRAARTRELGPGHLQVSVPPGTAGWLVVGESYSPLWTASVDGHERRIYPTNVASLGLPLDTGPHTVELRITATHAIVGLVISLLSAVALAGLALWGRFGRGRQRRS